MMEVCEFGKIENLETYTGLKSLWLENNCISEICGLENQTELVCLYLHNNMIKKIEKLDTLVKLDTINLCHNFITKIENLSILPVLNTLQMTHNKLATFDDIVQLVECEQLKILDLSYNYLDNPKVIEIFGKMKSLRVLTLTGNTVISKINYYRKSLILACNQLCYLDERPVTEKDRLCTIAWSTGGLEAEQEMRKKLINDEQRKISDSVNALIRRRDVHQNTRHTKLLAGGQLQTSVINGFLEKGNNSKDLFNPTCKDLVSVEDYGLSDSEESTTDESSSDESITPWPKTKLVSELPELNHNNPTNILDNAKVDTEGGLSTVVNDEFYSQHDLSSTLYNNSNNCDRYSKHMATISCKYKSDFLIAPENRLVETVNKDEYNNTNVYNSTDENHFVRERSDYSVISESHNNVDHIDVEIKNDPVDDVTLSDYKLSSSNLIVSTRKPLICEIPDVRHVDNTGILNSINCIDESSLNVDHHNNQLTTHTNHIINPCFNDYKNDIPLDSNSENQSHSNVLITEEKKSVDSFENYISNNNNIGVSGTVVDVGYKDNVVHETALSNNLQFSENVSNTLCCESPTKSLNYKIFDPSIALNENTDESWSSADEFFDARSSSIDSFITINSSDTYLS